MSITIGNWTFNKAGLTKVYSAPKNAGDKRVVVAQLLAGEWVKPLEKTDGEYKVAFRNGQGYVSEDEIGGDRMLELFFIDVGQGDSILVQTPKDRRILIDGGRDGGANGFLRWKYALWKEKNKEVRFDAIIMTHADADHAKGLINVLMNPKVRVDAVYHNGIARFKGDKLGKTRADKLVELFDDVKDLTSRKSELSEDFLRWVEAVEEARRRNPSLVCKRLDDKVGKLPGFEDAEDVLIEVQGPINIGVGGKPAYNVFGSAAKTLNGNSVVLRLSYKKAAVLLAGDMNEPAEKAFLRRWDSRDIASHVFKANHHGSQDFSDEFLEAVRPWVTVVSSGDFPDYGHPRASLLGSLGRYAPKSVKRPLVFATEIAATYRPLKRNELKKLGRFLYEKAVHGLINVRSDGARLVSGRVYGGKLRTNGGKKHRVWDWEWYEYKV